MKEFDFRGLLTNFDVEAVSIIWRECKPKLLVVTDGLNYSSGSAFGLTQFVSTLASSVIHGMTPQVILASRGLDPNANLQNFDFAHATHGLLKSRYDVLFLLGITTEDVNQLPQAQVDVIARFMQAGGGVFATGDHESLGASLSRDIPRVRNMRFWRQSETPTARTTKRLSTNLSGVNSTEDFNDQSDRFPQRLYLNFRTLAGGIGNAHPLLQSTRGNIEVFPDHPHEGECRIPRDLNTTFDLDGVSLREWPALPVGGRFGPEVVAKSMSHGDGFPAVDGFPEKEALEPLSFIAIAAYNGHRTNVGRVVTDATWHHFVNVNIDGTQSAPPLTGLQTPAGTDRPDLVKIRQYYRNLGTWLMPKNVRRCLRFPWLLENLRRYPLFEEVNVPLPGEAAPEQLLALGQQVAGALYQSYTRAEVDELLLDTLADAVGEESVERLLAADNPHTALSRQALGFSALGSLTIAFVSALEAIQNQREVDVHKDVLPRVEKDTRAQLARYLEAAKLALKEAQSSLAELR